MEKDIIREILESGCKVSMGFSKISGKMLIEISRGSNKTQYTLNANEEVMDENVFVLLIKKCIRKGISEVNENKSDSILCLQKMVDMKAKKLYHIY